MEQGTVLETNGNSRVRMNVNTTAKGTAQWEVTAEFPTVDEATDALNEAIAGVRTVIQNRGLTEAGATG